MSIKIKTLMIGVGALALAACSTDKFNSEAGAFLDEGGFGNPTMTNMLAQMCSGQAKGFVPSEPLVVLDPKSAPSNPRYFRGQVTCSGELNGKFAEVIFTEYVSGATTAATVSDAEAEGGS